METMKTYEVPEKEMKEIMKWIKDEYKAGQILLKCYIVFCLMSYSTAVFHAFTKPQLTELETAWFFLYSTVSVGAYMLPAFALCDNENSTYPDWWDKYDA